MKYLNLDGDLRVKEVSSVQLPGWLPVPDAVVTDVGWEYIPGLNAFIDPESRTTTARVMITADSDSEVVVAFPASAKWSVIDSGGVALQKTNQGLAVGAVAAGEYTVRLAVSSDEYNLTAELVLVVIPDGN